METRDEERDNFQRDSGESERNARPMGGVWPERWVGAACRGCPVCAGGEPQSRSVTPVLLIIIQLHSVSPPVSGGIVPG